MSYQVLVTPKAKREIDGLELKLRSQVLAKLSALKSPVAKAYRRHPRA